MMRNLFAALQQADSAFPSGGFGFSNGVEGLAALGLPLDRDGLQRVIAATLRHRWATADRIALIRAYRAGADIDAIGKIDTSVEATLLAEPF
ncbi:MAG: urease accessory protein UreF, partial [Terriglobia bacterium]